VVADPQPCDQKFLDNVRDPYADILPMRSPMLLRANGQSTCLDQVYGQFAKTFAALGKESTQYLSFAQLGIMHRALRGA
jgi:hypothetical protein